MQRSAGCDARPVRELTELCSFAGQNPDNETFQREVGAALESVLPRANLHPFTTLEYADKRDRLEDLHHYVLGIRLFNKALGKGGQGLKDKVKEASELSVRLGNMVMDHLQATEKLISDYQIVINSCYRNGEGVNSQEVPLKRLQDELTYRRQYMSFLQSFETEMAQSEEQAHSLVSRRCRQLLHRWCKGCLCVFA